MSNQCYNVVEISGDREQLKQLIDKINENKKLNDDGKISNLLEILFPVPDGLYLTADSFLRRNIFRWLKDNDKAIELLKNIKEGLISSSEIDKIVEDICKHYDWDHEIEYQPIYDDHPDIKTVFDLIKSYINNLIEYGHSDWYSWRVVFWGTESDAFNVSVTENDEELKLVFFTKGTPPIGVFAKVLHDHPDLGIKLHAEDEGYLFSVDFKMWMGDGRLEFVRTDNVPHEYFNH